MRVRGGGGGGALPVFNLRVTRNRRRFLLCFFATKHEELHCDWIILDGVCGRGRGLASMTVTFDAGSFHR